MSRRVVALILGLVLAGCDRESKHITLARDGYWSAPDGGLAGHAGSLSNTEVERIRGAIQKISFPSEPKLVMDLIPAKLKPKPILFADAFGPYMEDRRAGGNVTDYWLNESSVLRIATGYYSRSGKNYTLHERAEIIDPVHAYTDQVSIDKK